MSGDLSLEIPGGQSRASANERGTADSGGFGAPHMRPLGSFIEPAEEYSMAKRTNPSGQITVQGNESYLTNVVTRVKSISRSPAATYAGSGATAGAVVGTLLLGPLGAAIGGAVGGGLGGYLGAKREEQAAQAAKREKGGESW